MGERIDGPPLEDCVTGSHFASNGVLYDTKEVVKSKYFNTVYSEILLNEDCRTLADVAFGKFFTGDWLIELTKSVLNGNKEGRLSVGVTFRQVAANGRIFV